MVERTAVIASVVKAVEQRTTLPQGVGVDNRFSALYNLLGTEDTKPAHVKASAPSSPLPASSPDLSSRFAT